MQTYAKGGDEGVSGYQSLYDAHIGKQTFFGPSTKWFPEDAISSLTGIYREQIKMEGNDQQRIEKIVALQPGVYAISFHASSARHVITFQRSVDKAFIIDPNIGLMRCDADEIKKLLTMLISEWNVPKLSDWDLALGTDPHQEHRISVEKLSVQPAHWKDSKSGFTPITYSAV